MIHLARPTVSPEANIVFCCFVLLDLKSVDGRTDVQTDIWATITIITGRVCGSWPSGSRKKSLSWIGVH